MKTRRISRFGSAFVQALALALSASLTACIDSPLLNHVDEAPSTEVVAAKENTADTQKVATDLPKGCALYFKSLNLCSTFEWVKRPTDDEKGSFTLRFFKEKEGTESGPYVDPGYDVKPKLWMAGMGHGSSPVTLRPARDAQDQPVTGVYDATDVFFVMGGKWEIWIQLKTGDQLIEKAKVDFDFNSN